MRLVLLVLLGLTCCVGPLLAQDTLPLPRLVSLEWAPRPHKPRLWSAGGIVAVGYPSAMIGLWQAWYKDYPLQKFHFFNDMGEWNQMDKMGHFFSSYQESRLGYHLGRWAGMNNRQGAWTGFALGQLVQTSFEVFDGFSADWGFSWGDVGFNVAGSALFTAQQLAWKEQRIQLKMSAQPTRYPDDPIYPVRGSGPPTTLQARSDALYGTGPVNLFLKNYNTLTVWASVNPRDFAPEAHWWPAWLNVAAGMGGDNMFAGYGYVWEADKNCTGPDCVLYSAPREQYPRARQLYLSLDVDLTKIPVKNRALRTLFAAINIFKVPAPTLEWNTQRGLQGHFIYF